MDSYYQKYLKYKNKYLKLKNYQTGGGLTSAQITDRLVELDESMTGDDRFSRKDLKEYLKYLITKDGYSVENINKRGNNWEITVGKDGKQYLFFLEYKLGVKPVMGGAVTQEILNLRDEIITKAKIQLGRLNNGNGFTETIYSGFYKFVNFIINHIQEEFYREFDNSFAALPQVIQPSTEGFNNALWDKQLHRIGHLYRLPEDINPVVNNFLGGYFTTQLTQFGIRERTTEYDSIIRNLLEKKDTDRLFYKIVQLYFNGKIREEVNNSLRRSLGSSNEVDLKTLNEIIDKSEVSRLTTKLSDILLVITNLYLSYIKRKNELGQHFSQTFYTILDRSRQFSDKISRINEGLEALYQLEYPVLETDASLNAELENISRQFDIYNQEPYLELCRKYNRVGTEEGAGAEVGSDPIIPCTK